MKRIALAAVLLLAAAAIAGVARPEGARAVDGQAQTGDSITVSGNGAVAAVPTTAVFSFGVDVRAATAKAAVAANAREMRQVIAAVKAAGGRQVGTQSVSLSQVARRERRAVRLRRVERRLRDGRSRQRRSRDRRRGRRGRQPGERPRRCRWPIRASSTARRSRRRWPTRA